MMLLDAIQIGLHFALLIVLRPVVGGYMGRVFAGQRTLLSPLLEPAERFIYKLAGVYPAAEMRWTVYAGAVAVFLSASSSSTCS